MMERKCLFCGNKDLSNEHIIAQWLLKELGIYDKFISMSHLSTIGIEASNRKHPFSKLVNGLVCKTCNSGWMSDLENLNKTALTNILNYKDSKQSVDYIINNSFDFSRWAFKNAILFNYATNYRELVPQEHFHILYKAKIPNNVFIHIAFCEDEGIVETRQSPIQIILRAEDIPFNLNKSSYKISKCFKSRRPIKT
jgi:hypothetical protein